MFTGIIEHVGRVKQISRHGSNVNFTIETPLSSRLNVDQSVCHNGVCLTVTRVAESEYDVTAIRETLLRTNLGQLKKDDPVNLECSVSSARLMDGHIVQGHVDTTGEILAIDDVNGSWNIRIRVSEEYAPLMVHKGSVCIDGISLTIASLSTDVFEVSIIPYTMEHTNLKHRKAGDMVNIEFDIIGKYVIRYLSLQKVAR